jgi:glycosyltransferase involved in cell wall biosynthesis
MKILAFTKYSRNGASSRLRCLQYIPYLETLDFTITVSPLLSEKYLTTLYAKKYRNPILIFLAYLKRFYALLFIKRYDLIYIEYELFPDLPPWIEKFLNWRKIPYIVDYDDAIFHNYDKSTQWHRRLLSKKIDTVMRYANTVICGNTYLAKHAEQAGSQKVIIIPTVIDINRYPLQDSESIATPTKPPIVIGWIGSQSTVKYLDILESVIHKLSQKHALELWVIGAKYQTTLFPSKEIEWQEETEVTHIQQCDIGIMPLLDTDWERGKCGYKLIQYMAVGLPIVASPIGINEEIIVHGQNGYLATSTDEWTDYLETLIQNSALGTDMGKIGRKIVEDKYSLQANLPILVNTLKETVTPKTRKKY